MEILTPFVNGIIFGVPFCLAAGPVFFILIYAGANRGLRLSIAFATGVLLGDLVLILITFYFVHYIQDFLLLYMYPIKMFMCIFLLLLSGYTFYKKTNVNTNPVTPKYNVVFLFFIYGFILDVFNPSNVLIWAGVASCMLHYNNLQHIAFYSSSMLTIGALMFLLAFLSIKIKPFLGVRFLRIFNICSGLVYLVSSIIILFYLK
ncbi:MAG: LysE family transporter [Bacteroidota bacterium]|nr:LysE family transporter [Bacteroidota bacterium]